MSETTTARQFWIRAPGAGEIVSATLPPPGPGEVRVRTRYSGISRGTESLVFRGEVPASEHRTMRAPYQEGDFPAPVKYGYSSVGVVEAAGPAAGGASSVEPGVGRTVFCLFPHQDVYCVPAGAVFAVPDEVPPARAVLAANMETAINVAWDASPAIGDHVVVIGAGVVGLLAAWLCRSVAGARVLVVDVEASRGEVASRLGVAFSTTLAAADADVVIHASGSAAGLRSALRAAGQDATVVEASWHGSREVPLPLGEAFHSRRLTIRSSQVGRVPPARAPRWSPARRLALALDLLASDELDSLITGESAFGDLPAVMGRLSQAPGRTLCHRITYP